MTELDFVESHVAEALRAARAEADGDEKLARLLQAKTKARLISMSDEELWELARLTTSGGEAIEVVHERYKEQVRELRGTAGEWVVDIVRPMHDREGPCE